MLKTARLEKKQMNIPNDIKSSFTQLPSLLLSNNEVKEQETKDVGTSTTTYIKQPIIHLKKKDCVKRIRDINGFRQRAAGLCLRRIDSVLSGKGDSIMDYIENKNVIKQSDVEILLISGRGEKNYWVLPGGGIEKDETKEQAVIREVLEEAGVSTKVISSIGEFTNDERFHQTTLFLLSVMEMYDKWEDYEIGRKRKWMSVDDAMKNLKQSQISMFQQGITS